MLQTVGNDQIGLFFGNIRVCIKFHHRNRIEVDFVSKPLFVIGMDALLKSKRASGRDKDLRDIALLELHARSGRKSQC